MCPNLAIRKNMSINHYLINLMNKIQSTLDRNNIEESYAVILNLYDWKSAFDMQCPILGLKSFIRNGVRPYLLPVLRNFLQNRRLKVKWHNKMSSERPLNGGGPQGGTLGIWEYLSLTNNNLDFVKVDERFKFVDDASALEMINLLSIGLASYNIKQHVPSNIPTHNQIIQNNHLKSQKYLETLNNWSNQQKMELNIDKTKAMIFNFSKDKQFTVSLEINNKQISIVDNVKLLGTHITTDLKWELNTQQIVKRANARMEILRKIRDFKPKLEDMKTIYISYIRSILEQSCQVWNFNLTNENIDDLERVQKNAFRIILGQSYSNYESALNILNLEDLQARRNYLCKKFAIKCTQNEKTKNMFKLNAKINRNLKYREKYQVEFARTARYKQSAIPQMQRLLNT